MSFITQGPEGEPSKQSELATGQEAPYRVNKTNWKFLLIVIILAIVVGGGVLWFEKFKVIEEVIPSQLIGKKEIDQFLSKDSVFIDPNMPEEANYNGISAKEAALVVAQDLTEKGVKDIKIQQVIWFVAPFGGFYVSGNCSFDKEDNHYTLFVARIKDGSDGNIGKPTILFESENKTIWPSNLEHAEFLGGYEAMTEFYNISPLFALEEIKTGKVEINYDEIAQIQQSVDAGHQPWRLNPIMVLRSEMFLYGFNPETDYSTLYPLLDAATQQKFGTEITEINLEITHNSKVYIMTLIQPITGVGKIWTISNIEMK